MQTFFDKQTMGEYVKEFFKKNFINHISNLNNNTILEMDVKEFAEKLWNNKKMSKISLKKDEVDLHEKGSKQGRYVGQHWTQTSEYDYAKYKIPVSGNKDLLNVAPPTLQKPKPKGEINGYNVFGIIENGTKFIGNDKLEIEIKQGFLGWYERLEEYINALNIEVDCANEAMLPLIIEYIEKKQKEIMAERKTNNNLKPF